QHIFRIIQLSVRKNVTFYSFKYPERRHFLVQRIDFQMLLEDLIFSESTCIKSRFAVIRDSQVFITQFSAIFRHLSQTMFAIAISRVIVKNSFEVFIRQQFRNFVFLGEFDFSKTLPHFSWDILEVIYAEKLFLA